ncbi:hypothetical protein GV829_13330 [Sphingomonas lacunae]|uniref:Uncharacterized protein n=1 Tax=Sphingomonas lacunae TaxID=2698828 RepID=A0A6M4AW00_9SPHN|nr:hypothetical protein [Sphingomonas lacunae]QJQ33298.1 hypothetical protein GV829_13330 [Sphingomonas lacunae]
MAATAVVGLLSGQSLLAQDLPPARPLAQSSPQSVDPSTLDPEAAARLSAQQQLTASLARIAADSSDWMALSQAGRAAIVLGDGRAALGFLARAEALNSRDPTIKAALGAAMVLLEEPQGAMRYFDAAVSAGGLDRAYLGDRGLAFDLLGNQSRAQADYAVAVQSHPSAELTRRYAISLGISGQTDQAVQMLGPLLRAQDRAAWRSRAMILAMNGRSEEARQIARATMPAQLAQGIDPYLGLMDRLTPAQLAFASHFGRFPPYETVRAQPQRGSAVRVAVAAPTTTPTNAARGRDRATGNRGRGRTSTEANRRDSARATNRREATAPRGTAPTGTASPAPVALARADIGVPGLAAAPPPPSAPPAVPMVSQPVVQPIAPSSTPAPQPVPASVPSAAPTAEAVPTPGPAVTAAATVTTPAPPPQPVTAPQPVAETVAVTPTPDSAPASPIAAGAPIQGPPDTDGPGFSSLPSVATASNPPSALAGPASNPLNAAPVEPAVSEAATGQGAPAAAPVQAAPAPGNASADGSTVVPGWSLDTVVESLEVPEAERTATVPGLSLAEIEAIAAERRLQQEQQAAEARARARALAETRAREQAEVQARERAAAEAERRAEQERIRRHPARVWYQIATGADPAALAFDCRRLQRQFAEAFGTQTCSTASWNRTRRLVVGPFRNATAAREWGSAYSRAGGNAGFIWNSEAGEEVTPVGRR